ncbi:type VII secretion-associated protein (TIGR03931 family) [Rhodococcus sp. SMB37]|uniref:type VII secretion-associated protein n=1 Tax=Rhodococcus sp. SMB37 TaxID=2512213 RepID=UPI0010460A64|nr:type VII secretion-associated protein [Rhodococcus sp. SMB37]TCN57290.1 type VII secretion-associated protein (TIGR03931 family) [Rhodococcus sp. SMB37]
MAATVVSADVLGLHAGATSVCVRRAERIRHVPAVAARLSGGWVFGDAAASLETTDVLAEDRGDDSAELLTGLVRYAAAVIGAPPNIGTVVAVHPTKWSARRRDALYTAARNVARNAELVPAAVAACDAADVGADERCVTLEVMPDGVTATSLEPIRGGRAVIDRVARDPGLPADEVDSDDGATRLRSLIESVAGRVDPDVLLVTGIPGEPAGVDLCGRLGERIGRGIRVVPVAASEMLAPITEVLEAGTGRVAASRSEVGSSTAQWLQDVRAPMPEPSRAPRFGWMVAGALIVIVVVVAMVFISADEGAREFVADRGGAASAETVRAEPIDDASVTATRDPGASAFATIDLGVVRLDLPSYWRIRDSGVQDPGRAELLPDSGPDRRIVIVYSHLADGMDSDAVARSLAARATARSDVIRDVESDTRFGDRPVISYVEVPDEFSTVRWSVVVMPGLQVSIGCQFLADEWTGIRSECEQAVHTVEPV